ncbi:hypothetical protein B0J14DRAFT_700028 [Halenospora varia]|nr:hypothetical protein B0J14DRAFT_700028 [Halenospora varia]
MPGHAQIPAYEKTRNLINNFSSLDRISKFKDGFGDFCFFIPHPARNTLLPWERPQRIYLWQNGPTSSRLFQLFVYLPEEIQSMIFSLWVSPFVNDEGKVPIDANSFQILQCHPNRAGYSMYIPDNTLEIQRSGRTRAGPQWLRPHSPYSDLLALSQVNHYFRSELGITIWKNVDLQMNNWKSYSFIDFFRDRPAAMSGIKSLSMEWQADEEAKTPARCAAFAEFCEYISQSLDLEKLTLTLEITPEVAH